MITVTKLAKETGKTKAAASLFLSRHGIKPAQKIGHCKYFDDTQEPLAGYLRLNSKRSITPKQAQAYTEDGARLPLTEYLGDGDPLVAIMSEALENAREAGDYDALIAIAKAVQRERELENQRKNQIGITEVKLRGKRAEARSKELRNAERRGELIARELVKQQWGKACSVITSQLQSVGIKIAPQVCALCGVSDTRVRLDVQALIDREVYAACENVKRELQE